MMNLETRFELLRSHTALVVTISEEKQIHEANLKLIMARVNAATSLLKWAKSEGNPALHDTVEKLYDISLMWSTVQKQFAEQCLSFSKALCEILEVEQGLDAIKKEHQNAKEEVEKLQKQLQADASKRKSDATKISDMEEEIFRKSSNEEELAAEVQVKFIKGEIFKSRVIKGALTDLMDTYTDNATKVKTLCDASKVIIECLPDVPTHLSTDNNYQINARGSQAVKQLAKDLGLEQTASAVQSRPLSEMMPDLSSPPPSPTQKKRGIKAPNERKNKKKLSKLPSGFPIAKLIKHKYREKRSMTEDNDDGKPMGSSPPNFPRPKIPPPALPAEFRIRCHSSNLEREKVHRSRKEPLKRTPTLLSSSTNSDGDDNDCDYDDDDDDDENYEEPGYIRPNFYPRSISKLVRCSSDTTLSSTTRDDYTEPIDRYETSWFAFEDDHTLSDHLYDTPYDCLANSPTKSLPEFPQREPPPKPKRAAPKEAFYINTDEVEKLLNQVYGDSTIKNRIKPEVKHRALEKIAQERLETEDDMIESHGALVKQRIKSSDDKEIESQCISIVRKPEIKKRVLGNNKSGSKTDTCPKSDSTENSSPVQDNIEETSQAAKTKLRRDKVPVLPLKTTVRSDISDENSSKQSGNASPPGKSTLSPTSGNVKDLATMLQSKVNVSKNGKPQVPPRPIHSP